MGRWHKSGRALLDEISRAAPAQGEAYFWFMGQHGFAACMGGAVLYIDVVLGDIAGPGGGSLRAYPPPFAPGERQRVDCVLCTHDHADHMHMDTLLPLAEANPRAVFVVPAPCAGALRGAGVAGGRVLAARAGEGISLPAGVEIVPVPAHHAMPPGGRDGNGDFACLGFVLRGGGVSAYHAGDTWASPPLLAALRALAPLDVAMLPINGTDWERAAAGIAGNMGPLDAAKLARAAPFDLSIPAHYDMIEGNGENPARFAEAMRSVCPERRFHICALGERLVYRKGG